MTQDDPGKLLQDYQTGITELSDDEKPKLGKVNNQPEPLSYRDILRANPLSNTIAKDYTEQAKEEGFGLSRYDSDFYPEIDLEESRAIEQTGFSKIGTGLMKGGVTAATTALNTTVGTVFGLGSSLYELAADANGNGRSFMDTMDAGVNNWLSNQLVKIQNWAEDVFPNYRTAEERSEQYQREWWKHMGTANFIGDSILKNFGFTVGAMAGGMAWSKLIGAGLSKQLANNIMKGAIAAAEGDSEAAALMRTAAEAVKKGTATEAQQALARAGEAVARGTAVGIDADALVANIENAAKALNRYGAKLQLYGAAVGAMGEGTVEGIMAKNEFLEDYNRDWEEQYAREYGNLENDILQSGNPEWVDVKSYETPEGIQKVRTLTDAGRDELYKRQQRVTAEYQDAKEYAEQQGDRLSSTTFLLNLPILTASNAIQFGRMLSGGWKTSRAASKGIRGGLKQTLQGLVGDYTATGNVATRTVLGSMKVAGSEAFEEMAQGTISSGAKEVASRNLASFNNDGYDANAIDSVREWFSAMYAGGKDYLNDPKNWQEGAIGALTGLFGIPGKKWNGGVAEAYRDAKDKTQTARATALELSNRVNSKEFQNQWRGYIRHLKYDNGMDEALAKDDEYAWHSNDDNQLISDVIMFADAGKLGDLEQVVSYYANMSTDEAKSIKDAVESGKEGFEDYAWTKNLSPADIVAKVKEQATKIQDTINQYRDFYRDMTSRAPADASPELIKEMVFTAQQIKAYEKRFLTKFGETMDAIEPIIKIQSVFDKDNQILSNKEDIAKRFEEVKQSYERLFSMMGLPMKMPKALQREIDGVLTFMKSYAEGDEKLVQGIEDMRKLSNSRSVFYQKLITLQGEAGQRQYNEQAATQEDVDNAAIKQMNNIETEGLDTIEAVRKEYLDKRADEQVEFYNLLSASEDKNPAIKKFMDLKRKHDGFFEYFENNGLNTSNPSISPRMIGSMINDIFRRANSAAEYQTLPDNVFTPYDQFNLENKGLVALPASVYTEAKQVIRDLMSKYLGLDSDTASRNNIGKNPVTPSREGEEVQSGQDIAQPASSAPAPLPDWMKEQAEDENTPTAPVNPTENPVPQAEAAGESPIAAPATMDEVAEDANEASKESDTTTDLLEENGTQKIPRYGTSLPEISTEQATKVRDGDLERQDADFSDLPEYLAHTDDEKLSEADRKLKYDPQFKEIWNALYDAQAFATVALELSVNDEVEFVIDSKFPLYNDEPQILMATTKNGERKILTVLSQKTSKYYGLQGLRDAIMKEYNDREDKTQPVFVFSKKSRVWAKRAGQIDYDMSDKIKFSFDKGLKDIPAYNPDAPIMFINKNGDLQIVRGRADAAEKLPRDSFSADFRSKRKGSAYYLAKDGDNGYIPVRLYVEHFTSDNSGSDNPMYAEVRNMLSGIVKQAKNANKVTTDFAAENRKLHDKLAKFMKLLDASDVYMELGNYNNIGPALMLVTWERDKNGNRINKNVQFKTPDQLTDDWLISKIAEMGASFHVGPGADIDALIKNNLLTSNARMLRAKGVDFYVDPWDGEKFRPMTAEEVAAHDEAAKTQASNNNPHDAETHPVSERPDDSWTNADVNANKKKKEAPQETKPEGEPESKPVVQIGSDGKYHFDSFGEDLQNKLLANEWTAEEFDAAELAVQQYAIDCPDS